MTTSSSTSSQNITAYPSPVTQISQPTLELPSTTSGGRTTTSIAFVRTERSRTALETPEGSANDQPVTESPRLETSRTDLGSPAPTITPSAIIKTTQAELMPAVTASPQQQPAPAPQGLGGVIASILGVGATVSAVDAINGAGSSPEGSEGGRPGDRPDANGVSGAVVTGSQSAAAAILQTGGSVTTIARQSGVSASVPTEGGSEPAGTNGGSGSAPFSLLIGTGMSLRSTRHA
nr:hypothetical protein B0A51_12703 [Rachicladosporium sp. CCFEE 5018]